MTFRIYLAPATVRLSNESPQPTDIPVERVFINAGAVAEFWVETESLAPLDPGRAVTFTLARSLSVGFQRISGTIERNLRKQG